MMLDHIKNGTKPTDDEQRAIADVFVNYKGEGDREFYRRLPPGLTLTTYGKVQNKIYHSSSAISFNDQGELYLDRRKYYIGKPVIQADNIPADKQVQHLQNKDGVLGAVRDQLSQDPSMKIAIGVCGNSGQPAGGLVFQDWHQNGLEVQKTWYLKNPGQEEGIMREVLPLVYMDHHKHTGEAKDLWGRNYTDCR